MVESGTVLDGRYRVISRLGSGGMADVYLAQDTLLGRQVALKLLHHRFSQDQEFVERFRREASSAAGLSHPNVVSVFDRGEWDDTYYIAMEYLPGRSLKAVLREHGPLSPEDAIDITIQILLALRFAHKRGIIHRDIKPHNVILDEEGRAKVTDFGIARAGASDMTMTGSIMGTAQYLSPEQAQGYAVSEASDIYAVGVVLYELLTGSVPFEGESAVTIALKQVSVEPTPPSQRNPQVSPALDAVVMRAMAKDPAARFAGADELIAALQQARAGIVPALAPIANGAPPTAAALVVPPLPPEGDGQPGEPDAAAADAAKKRRRARWIIAAGVAALAIVVAVLLLLLLPGKSAGVTVPDVTGETQSAALATLKHEGLVPVVSVSANAHVASGLVIGTTPPRGTIVHKAARVSVFVSSGAESVAVPNVVHRPSAEAVKILEQKGLQPSVQSEPSETVSKGLVVSTDPTAGVGVQISSPVTLFVSSGPREASVPEVTGETQASATATLAAAGLKVTTIKREVAEPAAGTVISQSPAAGTQLKPDSTVTIVVAQAPAKTAVPNVVGRSEVQAIAALKTAGFEATTVTRTVSEEAKVGIVLQQSPAAGAKLAKGQVVTLAIGKLAQQTTSTATTPTPQPPGAAPSAGAPSAASG
ncbi:MAG TPA: Stk1 family PASTA domain-containing Ser/Thr kinase [Solirubrobacteraceae bacterium]|jgi:serine/threonine-protein kinase|nr:Stk1 family PASTA domain-containing Ser/Thr kinase [Solirubrobacteraceae bacterium]